MHVVIIYPLDLTHYFRFLYPTDIFLVLKRIKVIQIITVKTINTLVCSSEEKKIGLLMKRL